MPATSTRRTFIDVHVLQTVPPSCINRDDNGSPKTATYGGVVRHRVSSQAWKRATRNEFNRHLDTSELGERTLLAVERIAKRVQELDATITEDDAAELAKTVLNEAGVKTKEPKTPKNADEPTDKVNHEVTGYLVFLSRAQVNALAELAVTAHRTGTKVSKKDAKNAFTQQNSIDVALFGRMIADAPETNVDAACQVSHAISVHGVSPEFDYFTAVDDNLGPDNVGAGMIGTVEFVSSTLYRYATINAELLSKNLGSDEAAIRAVEAFINAFVVSMPTGKQNTFANRTRPGMVLVEIRDDQPTNLVAAFERPVDSEAGRLSEAAKRLVEHAIAEDDGYGTAPLRSGVLVADPEVLEETESILARATKVTMSELTELVTNTLHERLGSDA